MAEASGGEQRSMSWHCLAAGADGPVLTDPAETRDCHGSPKTGKYPRF